MDRRFLTVLGLALVLALVVSLVFFQLLVRRGSSKTKAVEMRDVVVAARALPVGVTIKPEDVKLNKVSADQFPKNAFSRAEEVVDRPVTSNILPDEPVLQGRLGARGSGRGLAPIIPVGMRAVAVRVTDVAGVAGFVLPGLLVDVLVTGTPPGGEGSMTTTCLQNILVLSAGQVIQPTANGQAIQTPTVTLLVTPEQAEILTLANEGRIQLVLRNSGDQDIANTPGRDIAEIYNRRSKALSQPAEREPRPAAAPRPKAPVVPAARVEAAAPPPAPPPPQIVVIRGNQRSVEVVPAGAN
jgi:pilus assembly protein CpaB